MTTIAYKDGVMASDSQVTWDGYRKHLGEKIFRKKVKRGRKTVEVLIGISGELSPALVFVDWYGTDAPPPAALLNNDCDFVALIAESTGKLYSADRWCRPAPIADKFFAVGSGCDLALVAMRCGKTAREAIELASEYDSFTGGRVVYMKFSGPEK